METLLTHREWVRRLARSLVHDDASADDVEQRTWLTALRFPPRRAETARAWLAAIVRSQASNAWRDERRRDAREIAAARPEATRSAADVVAEAESHKRLVLAVMALEEPYRTTVLLRWFEDLPPRHVASRMGVPVETVRTRLRRAHEQLRSELGGGPEIAFVLAPLLAVRPGWATTTAASAGGTIVGTKTAVTVAGVVVAFGAGFLVREVAGGGGAPTSEPAEEVASLGDRVPSQAQAKGQTPSQTEARPDAERRPPSSESRKIAALQQQAEDQQARIDALEAALASVKATAAAPPAAPQRADAPKQPGLAEMSDAQLLEHIKALVAAGDRGGPIDAQAVLDACAVLLARPLGVPTQAEVLVLSGIGYRVKKDRAAEEAAFRKAIEVAGPRTPEGRSAASQLAWTASRNREPRSAAEQFLALSLDTDAPAKQRSWNRYFAASNFEQAGDTPRALTEYRGVVEEYGQSDDGNARKAAELAGSAIKRIESPGAGR